MNNVDLEAAAERGIEVRNAVGYSTHAVTETTIGAAIALLRQSIYYDRYVKSGEYAASDAPFHSDGRSTSLRQTLGYHRPGSHRAQGRRSRRSPRLPDRLYFDFGCRTAGTLPRHAARRTAPLVGHRVDPRSLERPHARPRRSPGIGPDETFGPIDQRSPRCIVDEQALADALDNKRLAGAGIDVFSREPMSPDNPPAACNRPRPVAALAPHGLGPGRSTRNIGRLHRTEYRNLFGRTAIVRRRRSDRMRKPRTELKFSRGFLRFSVMNQTIPMRTGPRALAAS